MASKVARHNKSNRAWIDRHINDPFVKQAQQQGYRSRAAFKLLELIDQERLARPGQTVIDLGSVPGAWSQVLARRVGLTGRVVALDILPMEPLPHVEFLQGDFRDVETLSRFESLVGEGKVALVASDMAPNLSGVAVADAARMGDLAELALEFADSHLSPDGVLVVKCFHGSGFSQLVQRFKQVFRVVRERKPQASRAESAETYLVGRGLKEVGRE